MTTPRATGFRVPFEGGPAQAIWTAWPAHPDLWQDALSAVRQEVAQLLRALAPTPIHLLVATEEAHQSAQAALPGLDVRFLREPYGDIWLRDTLPVYLLSPQGKLGHVRFRFDGWGGKYRLDGDDDLAIRIARQSPGHAFSFDRVLEGGSVETDGDGTLLTTRQCLLDGVRNPGLTEAQAEAFLCEAYGAEKVLWLDQGLLNDHTDGHIDTLARFLKPGRVVCMTPDGPDDPNAPVLREIEATLRGFTDARGRPLEVLPIPSPGRVLGDDGQVLPASHVNFVMTDRVVVVPTYGGPQGPRAVDALRPHVGARTVLGSPAQALLSGGGAFHCITQHVPQASPQRIP